MTVSLDLPFPPSANRLWRHVPGKGTLKSAEYRKWLAEALALMRVQRAQPVKGSYHLRIYATRPDRRRRDVDNLAKAVSDALKAGGVIEDDHLAKSVFATWLDTAPRSGGAITVAVDPA